MPPSRARSAVAGVFGLMAAALCGWWFNRFQPLDDWFIFRLGAIWAWQLFFVAACVSTGHLVVTRLISRTDRNALQTAALSFPAGLVVFLVSMYAGGFLHLFGPVFAVLLPAVMLAVGLPALLRGWREAGPLKLQLSGLPLVASVGGVLLVGVVYLGALSPEAINYDASWMHQVIAQDFAREGRIIGFPGNWVLNTPHSASLIYTWSFIVPGFEMPALRWMMALHTNFVVVVWCLVGIAAAARWLAERELPGLWAAFALFPALFVYDSNIGGAADHFAMLFAPVLLLVTAIVAKQLDRGACVLWGAFAGAALICKLQAVYVVAPLAVVLTVRALLVWRAAALPRRTLLKRWALLPAAALVVMLCHLGGNLAFFNNPVYPLGQRLFTASSPTVPGGADGADFVMADSNQVPTGSLRERVGSSAALAFSFSFVAHYSFLNSFPIFGSLFTLSLPLLLLLRRARRLWLAASVAVVALFLWAMTYRVDRNLMLIYPLMVAVTAALLARAWELGALARAGIALMVAVQLAWGSALYVSGLDRIGSSIALLRSTIEGQARAQLERFRADWLAVGSGLPPDAKVMTHHNHRTLGFNRPVILDMFGFQGVIDYRAMKSARDLHDRLRELGVTHVVMFAGRGPSLSVQEEIVFDLFVDACGQQRGIHGGFVLFPMCKEPPPRVQLTDVVLMGIPNYADGLYAIEATGTNDQLPAALKQYGSARRTAPASPSLLGEASAVLARAGTAFTSDETALLANEFRAVTAGYGWQLWVRTPRAPAAAEAPTDARCQAAADFYGIESDAKTGFAPVEVKQWFGGHGCHALPRSTTSQQCQNASNLYGIVGNASWGGAPEAVRAWWTAAGCNTGPKCQELSELYGVAAGLSFGAAPAAVHEWWKKAACETTPAGGVDTCRIVAQSFGMKADDSGYAPAAVLSWWHEAKCDSP